MHKIIWIGMFLVITAVILVLDLYFFETFYIGATARFVWNSLAFAAQSFARSIEAIVALAFRRRITRIFTGIITAVGLVYVSHLILTDAQVRTAYGWREKVRIGVRKIVTVARNFWLRLHFVGKCTVVVVAIWAQIHFFPSFATWIVLFPIAFLIPPLQWLWRNVSSWVVDTLFGDWYWKKYGRRHRSFLQRLQSIPVLRQVRGAWRITRLRYLTAWRMWRYEECYRIAKNERRRISLFEPLRLWWLGELDRYIGRPLFDGGKQWPLTTYVPPVLWYDDESPRAQFVRRIVSTGAMLVMAFSMRGSVRR